ncbi:putative polysaccharide biosynthesis protein [Pseudalkalibacillus berkeleyi]|uniref:Polysaccharide biosynthesis protein n=1 Tax=Pseudalkalibacillus berkeleyi TaxID=1069813 RepID=A0ABS9H4C2_9BACL|nr:polysaccharide biosynthesis protein [Pseudalkalibacillus berkeleyi]MCF6138771.1 polysaccharide biosynthesis protein [Pseudalkalibacillus berkeleyi]
MSNQLVKSTFVLTIATLLSKILGSIFRIPLQNIAGDEVLGIFSLVYPVYMTALILSVAGIPIAISQLIAKARTSGDQVEVRNIFLTASILGALFGIVSFLLISGFSATIAEMLGGQKTRLSLIVVSLTLLIAPYMAVYRGFFQGYEDMRQTAYSQVIEQLIRVVLIIGIAYYMVQLGYSNEKVSGGVMVGSSIGALISLIYLRILFKRSVFKPQVKSPYSLAIFKKTSKRILVISLPICVGALTMALINVVDSLSIPFSLKWSDQTEEGINYLYGLYGRGLSLVQIATVFSTSIVLPLIPTISKSIAKKDIHTTNNLIEKSQRLGNLLSWPAALGLFSLTLPLNLALFTNMNGSSVLAIISLSSVFTALTVLGTGILQGLDRSRVAAFIIVLGAIVKVGLNVLFIQYWGLIGAAVSTLVIYILLFIVNSIFIYKYTGVKFYSRATIVHAGSSILMGMIIGLPTLFLAVDEWSRVVALGYSLISMMVGGVIYFILIIRLKGISNEEIGSIPGIKNILKK